MAQWRNGVMKKPSPDALVKPGKICMREKRATNLGFVSFSY
jgi:hypothetical protein